MFFVQFSSANNTKELLLELLLGILLDQKGLKAGGMGVNCVAHRGCNLP